MQIDQPQEFDEAVNRIVEIWEKLSAFWTQTHGWAPPDVAALLATVSLDDAVSLSRTLRDYGHPPDHGECRGRLILGWTTLGSLVEAAIKLFLIVYNGDYIRSGGICKAGEIIQPTDLKFETARTFVLKHAFVDSDRTEWSAYISDAQRNRNGIHLISGHNIDTWDDLRLSIVRYAAFIARIDDQLPYP